MERGTEYARTHLTRFALVGVVRELRVFGLFAPRQQATLESVESRSYHWQLLAWVAWLPAVALGIAGFTAMLRRRGRDTWGVVGVVASFAIVAPLGYRKQ